MAMVTKNELSFLFFPLFLFLNFKQNKERKKGRFWSPDLILLDNNAPRPHLQKGISPFGYHHAGAILRPAVSTNYITQIGAYFGTHNQQPNQQ